MPSSNSLKAPGVIFIFGFIPARFACNLFSLSSLLLAKKCAQKLMLYFPFQQGRALVMAMALSNSCLVETLKGLVGEERKILAQILEYLREVERRKIFLEIGYPSLFEFCIRELGYSEGSAQRRISAMRLIRAIPEIKPKIVSGELSLSVVSQAQTFFRSQEKEQRPLDKTKKLDLLK